MPRSALPAADLKSLVAARAREYDACRDLSADSLIIIPSERGWLATVKREGQRIDEARLAVVAEISRCLTAGYELLPEPALS